MKFQAIALAAILLTAPLIANAERLKWTYRFQHGPSGGAVLYADGSGGVAVTVGGDTPKIFWPSSAGKVVFTEDSYASVVRITPRRLYISGEQFVRVVKKTGAKAVLSSTSLTDIEDDSDAYVSPQDKLGFFVLKQDGVFLEIRRYDD